MIPTSPIPFAALLFDLDGVLVDSEPAANRVWVELLAGHGLSVSHADFLARSVGRTHQELHDGLRRDYGWTRPPDFDALSDAALALAFLGVEAVPGSGATLAALEAAGIP
ncbi:MAG: HAD family hydrolase, partial [Deinococcus sp.]